MRFSCGETRSTKKARLSEWHPFFVFFPRSLGEENGRYVCVWFETIQRRGEYTPGDHFNNGFWTWYYKANDGDELV